MLSDPADFKVDVQSLEALTVAQEVCSKRCGVVASRQANEASLRMKAPRTASQVQTSVTISAGPCGGPKDLGKVLTSLCIVFNKNWGSLNVRRNEITMRDLAELFIYIL